jgi:outer membrane protein OmpA-like peptidoglycan-associated protein
MDALEALSARDSIIRFENISSAVFSARGTALKAENSRLYIEGELLFKGNGGGRIDFDMRSLELNRSTLAMTGVIRVLGGLKALESDIDFDDGFLTLGGFVRIENMFSFAISNTQNAKISNAIFNYDGNSSPITLSDSRLVFVNSSAAFRNNGTAIYVDETSVLEIAAGADYQYSQNHILPWIEFRGNAVDIHLAQDAVLLLRNDAAHDPLRFTNGIRIISDDVSPERTGFMGASAFPLRVGDAGGSAASGVVSRTGVAANVGARNVTNRSLINGSGQIKKIGIGDVVVMGYSEIGGGLDIEQGRMIFTSSASIEKASVYSDAVLSMADGVFVHSLIFDSLILSTGSILEIDADFSVEGDSDEIEILGSAQISSAIVRVHSINRDFWVYGSSMPILRVADADNFFFEALFTDSPDYAALYQNGTVYLVHTKRTPKFSAFLGLTHNQREVAKFLDKAANPHQQEDVFRYARSKEEYEEYIDDLSAIIADIGDRSTMDEKLEALDALSGSFLAQSITRLAAHDARLSLYPRIKSPRFRGYGADAEGIFESGMWIEVSGDQSSIDDRRNKLGVFKDTKVDGRLGFSFIEYDIFTLGVFAGAGQEEFIQGANKALASAFEGGVYGGLFSGNVEGRFFVSVGLHNVDSKRELEFDKVYTSKSQYEASSLKWGFEASAAMPTTYELKPFAGVRGASVNTGEIAESGGGASDLTFDAANYVRLSGYGGLKIGLNGFYLSAEAGYLMRGNYQESLFSAVLNKFNYPLAIEGSTVDPLYYAFGVGTEKSIGEGVFLFAGANITRSRSGYEGSFGGNVGVKIVLSQNDGAKDYWQEKQRAEREKALELERRRQEAQKRREAQRARKILVFEDSASTILDANLEVPPIDERAEERLRRRAEGRELMGVHILKFKDGQLKWETVLEINTEIFEEGSAKLPQSLISSIKELMQKLERESAQVGRTRIIRYGAQPTQSEADLARARGQAIYDEMNKYKEIMTIIIPMKKGGVVSESQMKQAMERRQNALSSYRIKAASFEVNSTILSPNAAQSIKLLAQEIKKSDFKNITVEGHTDGDGSQITNLRLSEARAKAVLDELVKNGITASRVKAIGFASAMPVAPNATTEQKALNRRVEIFVE